MLVHGRLGWSYGADLDQTPSKDEALDDISPYWLTNTTISPARRYWENRNVNLISAAAQDTDRIRIPMAITPFPHDDLYRPPETWARRAFPGLVYFSEAGRGVHFPAWEEPALFAAEMRAAFEPLPSAG
jgi:pimeloyl-ACP methyl ester carboxylesterase